VTASRMGYKAVRFGRRHIQPRCLHERRALRRYDLEQR
jgi:hypothetical protein